MSDRLDVNQLLMEMRALKAQTQAFGGPGALASQDIPAGPNAIQNAQKTNGPQFGDLLSQAVDGVNEIQHAAGNTARAYINGDPNVDIAQVMIANQKSGIAFDSVLQVRNRVVEAYREVMNMPI